MLTKRITAGLLMVSLVFIALASPLFGDENLRRLDPGGVINSRVDRIMSVVDSAVHRPASIQGKKIKWAGRVASMENNGDNGSFILEIGENLKVKVTGKVGRVSPGDRILLTGIIVEENGFFSHIRAIKIKVVRKKPAPQYTAKRTLSGGDPGFAFIPQSKPLELFREKTAKRLSCWITTFPNGLSIEQNLSLARWIVRYSKKYKLDWRLAASMIAAESSFRIDAVSPVGAMGLGQLMPGTAKLLRVSNPFNPKQNIRGSLLYLSNLFHEWKGYEDRYPRALAGYNAGPYRVRQYDGIPPYRETVKYIRSVYRYYNELNFGRDECVYKSIMKKTGTCPIGDCCKDPPSEADKL
ncbi:MAG: lytic transglycosylase domain-containing protein [Deltaproteobacteria bacterium]|nr:lytic transglycosylase domain-containing protein [Deltaproteobacteria bacterium]